MNTNQYRRNDATHPQRKQSTRNRSHCSGPVFLRAFADHERETVARFFAEAAQDGSKTPTAVVSSVRSACQCILHNEQDFFTRQIANRVLGRIDMMPQFAISYAGTVLDGGSN